MKLKIDFVTNSSSTSFVAIGCRVDLSEIMRKNIDKLIEIFEKNENEAVVDELKEMKNSDSFGTSDTVESYYFMDELLGKDLTYAQLPYDDDVLIGITYSSIDDNTTIGEIKKLVKVSMKEKLGIDVEPHHIEESWMDN